MCCLHMDAASSPPINFAPLKIETTPLPKSYQSGGYLPQSSSPSSSVQPRKKQKRNKPTLSCEECVERKTKCDRGRPHCLACIKRQTECQYAYVANVLEETNRFVNSGRRMTKPPKTKVKPDSHMSIGVRSPVQTLISEDRTGSRNSASSSSGLMSDSLHQPSIPTASNVFGIGSEHPFSNYWTCEGGLPEVISVLPEKIQADILLERYFEVVDGIYPMIHRQTFYADYEQFWALPQAEKNLADGALVALIFAMLAMGTQFVTSNSTKQTAEFYVSACHQALRMSSFMNKTSIRSIQAMLLVVYFLINDNHASDGWAFAGILLRQTYAMGLHRDPDISAPNATVFEKQQRRKLWQAVLLQDTFITVLLSLPPSATHTDVFVDSLVDDSELSSIASSSPSDTSYIRGNWTLANLVQESICSPRSLDLPICSTPRQKAKLLSDFRAVYRSFPDVFRSWDAASLTVLAQTNKRIVRQTLWLTSNYWHNVMLLHSSSSAEVPINIRSTLEAAHDAISAFFLLVELFGSEARVWWVFNHRAFLEAICMADILRDHARDEIDGSREPLYARARSDIARMTDITEALTEGDDGWEVAKTRVAALRAYS